MHAPRVRSLGPGAALLAVLLGGCGDDLPAAASTSNTSSGSEITGPAPMPTTSTSTSTGASTNTSDGGSVDATTTTGGTGGAGEPGSATDASRGGSTTSATGGETSPEPRPGTCCAPQDSPGCSEDPALEACVCGLDPFCCETWWDELCIGTARDGCGLECTASCCEAHSEPSCDDQAVADCVCGVDDFCCQTWWNDECVNLAQYQCQAECGLPPANMGDCCMPQPAPGCSDVAVAECACLVDGICCSQPWSEICIQTAVSACEIECEGYDPIDPCCYVQPMPTCGNVVVETCVCAFDPFCCDTQWDGICVDGAQNQCALDCSGSP